MNVDRLALIGCGVLAAARITLFAVSPAPHVTAAAAEGACLPSSTITVDAHTSTPCNLDGSQTLNLTWEGADGYDDAEVRAAADRVGCGRFTVIDGVATGLDCDY